MPSKLATQDQGYLAVLSLVRTIRIYIHPQIISKETFERNRNQKV